MRRSNVNSIIIILLHLVRRLINELKHYYGGSRFAQLNAQTGGRGQVRFQLLAALRHISVVCRITAGRTIAVACLPVPRAKVFSSFLRLAWWPPLLFLVKNRINDAGGDLPQPLYPYCIGELDSKRVSKCFLTRKSSGNQQDNEDEQQSLTGLGPGGRKACKCATATAPPSCKASPRRCPCAYGRFGYYDII
jgi:hypothetical protein